MSTPDLGHAAFHLEHTVQGTGGNRADRSRILKESMRHLSRGDVKRHAAKNANIVAAESNLNTAFVNDGNGAFRVATNVKEVLDYGDVRQRRVRRKLTEVQRTINRFVIHLPASLCVEVPDFYLRLDEDGQPVLDTVTQQPMMRSRNVARDSDEAMRYFADAIEVLTSFVIPGGHAAVHGWATNFDESTPHVQLMADPFAPDPKAPAAQSEALRTHQSQAYSSHRDVVDADGKQISGSAKLRGYQEMLRTTMADKGWPVDYEVSARHGRGLSKADFEELQDGRAAMTAKHQAMEAQREDLLRLEGRLQKHEMTFAETQEAFEREVPRRRREATDVGRAEGLAKARAAIELRVEEAIQAGLRPARAALDERLQEVEGERDSLRRLERQVERELEARGPLPELPKYEDIEREVVGAQSDVAMRFIRGLQAKDGSYVLRDRFETYCRQQYGRFAAEWKGKAVTPQEWSQQTKASQDKIRRAMMPSLHSAPEPAQKEAPGFDQ